MAGKYEHELKNCWEIYSSEKEKQEMNSLAAKYLDFLGQCKTERETIDWARKQALQAGFQEDLSADCCFRVFRDKTILLARKGKRPLSQGIRLLGAHADSPRLDLKQRPLYEDCDVALAKTHYYGGIRKYQWLARALALHGVIIRNDGQSQGVCLGEEPGEPVFVIADLLPHLAQKQNQKKVVDAFEGEKLNILLGHAPRPGAEDGQDKQDKQKIKAQVLELLHNKYGIVEQDLYSAELQAVPAEKPRYVGLDGSLLGGYGQDDRICVFAAMQALLQETDPEYTQVVIFWDKEEIGSEGATSARSMFFEYSLQELIDAWEPKTSLGRVLSASKAVSGDVHGAIDPDYQDLHEKMNSSRLGYGPVFCKFTGHRGKVGANDARAEYVGWILRLLNRANVPWQMAEIGKVDAGGGGTVAKHLAIYGLDIIDFGPGLLGMHSPFEISSKADLYATTLAYGSFLSSGE